MLPGKSTQKWEAAQHSSETLHRGIMGTAAVQELPKLGAHEALIWLPALLCLQEARPHVCLVSWPGILRLSHIIQVVEGKLSAGELSSFVIYALYVGGNVGSLASVISNLIQVRRWHNQPPVLARCACYSPSENSVPSILCLPDTLCAVQPM